MVHFSYFLSRYWFTIYHTAPLFFAFGGWYPHSSILVFGTNGVTIYGTFTLFGFFFQGLCSALFFARFFCASQKKKRFAPRARFLASRSDCAMPKQNSIAYKKTNTVVYLEKDKIKIFVRHYSIFPCWFCSDKGGFHFQFLGFFSAFPVGDLHTIES